MTSTNTYTVTGMTCGHCEGSVREGVSQLTGVVDVEADRLRGVDEGLVACRGERA